MAVAVMVMLVIVLQHCIAEIVIEVAVDAMNVVGVVLRVVILDQKRWTLD